MKPLDRAAADLAALAGTRSTHQYGTAADPYPAQPGRGRRPGSKRAAAVGDGPRPTSKIRSAWIREGVPIGALAGAFQAAGLDVPVLWTRNVHDGRLVALVALEPIGWRLSISHARRYPTWDEIAHARYELLPAELTFSMLLPPPDEYVAVHNFTFHLHELDRFAATLAPAALPPAPVFEVEVAMDATGEPSPAVVLTVDGTRTIVARFRSQAAARVVADRLAAALRPSPPDRGDT